MNRGKREQLAQELDQARAAADAAIQEINGNPQVVAALESLEDELDAIKQALNLDIEV